MSPVVARNAVLHVGRNQERTVAGEVTVNLVVRCIQPFALLAEKKQVYLFSLVLINRSIVETAISPNKEETVGRKGSVIIARNR